MQPILQKVVTTTGSSWALLHRQLDGGIPFEWHYHPEFELTLTTNSFGNRLIGDHVDSYEDGDLVLIGPNLPHSWRSHGSLDGSAPHVAIVAWFTKTWADDLLMLFPEMSDLQPLLEEARRGVQFSAETAAEVRPLIESIPRTGAADRLMLLFKILQALIRDKRRRLLASPDVEAACPIAPTDDRMRRVLDYLHSNYRRQISMEELAEIACRSLSATHRLFRRHTRMTPIEYVTRLRIGRACSALMEGEKSIAAVAERELEMAKLAANRVYNERWMSEAAKAHAASADESTIEHLAEIPETPVRRSPGRPKKVE